MTSTPYYIFDGRDEEIEQTGGLAALIAPLTGFAPYAERWDAEAPLGTPVVLTYSFGDQAAAYDTEPGHAGNVRPFTAAQEAHTRAALDIWEDAGGFTFVEVDDDFGADIRFAMVPISDADAYAYFPFADRGFLPGGEYYYQSQLDNIGGDVFFDSGLYLNRDARLAPGTEGFTVMLHEIGHALGFDHTFEGEAMISDQTLENRGDFSIMSYGWIDGRTELGDIDLDAVEAWYGTRSREAEWNEDKNAVEQWAFASDDWVIGRSTRDILHGLDGDDTMVGRGGDDTLYGNAGSDAMFGGEGSDEMRGGLGGDTLRGEHGDDLLYGRRGDDTVFGGNGRDIVYLNQGSDLFNDNGEDGASGRDTVYGGFGEDTVEGGGGDDAFYGQWGADVIYGRIGNDQLYGGGGADVIAGGQGNDDVYGGNGEDEAYLGRGNDTFTDTDQGGDLGRDRVWGGDGNDTITGGGGADTFRGEGGNDVISGGRGKDVIVGGTGDDTLTGGGGPDQFIFDIGDGANVITDFEVGLDHLQIETAQGIFNTVQIGQDLEISWFDGKVLLEGIDQAAFSLDDVTLIP